VRWLFIGRFRPISRIVAPFLRSNIMDNKNGRIKAKTLSRREGKRVCLYVQSRICWFLHMVGRPNTMRTAFYFNFFHCIVPLIFDKYAKRRPHSKHFRLITVDMMMMMMMGYALNSRNRSECLRPLPCSRLQKKVLGHVYPR
jgi:hypothetical protein